MLGGKAGENNTKRLRGAPLEAKVKNAIFKLNFSNLVCIPIANILLKINYSFPIKYCLLSCLFLPRVLMRLPGLITLAN